MSEKDIFIIENKTTWKMNKKAKKLIAYNDKNIMGQNENIGGRKSKSAKVHLIKEQEIRYIPSIYDKQDKEIDESWDFRNANTKEYTHCFHSYPAMMIPQVARRIIDIYGKKSNLLFDPYCGTGTSLVEANLKGINAIGTDINPLARLIAKSKTTRINIQVLDLYLHDFMDFFFYLNFKNKNFEKIKPPQITNIEFWFSDSVQKKLSLLLQYIENIKDNDIKDFFKVAFSETVRETSFLKPGEFKLVRKKNYDASFDPDVFGLMIMKLSRNKKGLIAFNETCKMEVKSSIYDFNTVNDLPYNRIYPNSIDIVVTSPPYGDSRTTVAYGQYSRLANEWLGYKEAKQIDNFLMGGEKKKEIEIFKSSILNDIITEMNGIDSLRTKEVVSFFRDYEKSITNVAITLKKGAFACYVVGNRTVKGIKIPTDKITVDFFKENKFSHIETIERNIPNKRMPSKNSPSNITGVTSSTMKNEYIVVCQKN
jgi:tRNA G10  N-methylase Trm11